MIHEVSAPVRVGAGGHTHGMTTPQRCFGTGDPLMEAYHDAEWGRPVHDERGLFERIALEGFQSGLSWAIVLLGASITASLNAFDYRPASQRLPRGHELTGLLRVLGHFVVAQREGRGLHSAQLCALEPFLTDDLLQRYLGDLHRVGVIRRGELGEWMVVRDLAQVRLLELVDEGGYRVPLDADGLDGLTAPAAALIARLGGHMREALGLPLSALFAPDVPSQADIPAPKPVEHA